MMGFLRNYDGLFYKTSRRKNQTMEPLRTLLLVLGKDCYRYDPWLANTLSIHIKYAFLDAAGELIKRFVYYFLGRVEPVAFTGGFVS
jgi:hypothetical protein